MKTIETQNAVGHILCHDITKIVPDEFKGVAFKKGHVVREEDIETLLNLGKKHLYVFEMDENMLHENEAAEVLGTLGKGQGVLLGKEIKEGKISFYSEFDGLLKVSKDYLFQLNSLGEIAFATLPNNYPVKKNTLLGGARVIPLLISTEKIERAQNLVEETLLQVLPFKKYRVGIIITGSEVYHGRIEDKFSPVIVKKLRDYGCEIVDIVVSDDNRDMIKNLGESLLKKGADMLIFTGGMSVDPDDLTPSAILTMGGELISYGSPVLPGSMFLLSYLGNIPVMGLPGCVMYAKKTIFDLMLPRIMAREKISDVDIALLGSGGLCQNCENCHFPNCSFGKH